MALSKMIQKECCFNKRMSDILADIALLLHSNENETVLKPTANLVINEELSKALKKNPFMKADAIRKIYVKSLKGYLDREFEEYCTCDDYYQPVVEDFELDYHLKDWCKKNGFKIISCEGDGDDSGFEPDSVRRWIKYQT